jgi:hypothetical protein
MNENRQAARNGTFQPGTGINKISRTALGMGAKKKFEISKSVLIFLGVLLVLSIIYLTAFFAPIPANEPAGP